MDKIENEQNITKLNDLLERIKTLEIELYGASEINSQSPYEL